MVTARLRVTFFAALATALGSLSLLPIYDSYAWVPRVALMIGAAAVTAAVFQRFRLLAAAAPLAMALVWAGLLTLLYAHKVAPLGFIPGPAALRALHLTLSSGFTDTTQLAAPVDVTRGLSLMTTGGVGLVAIVVQTLAGTLRRPAVAGLPLLAIFTVPAAIISKGVGWQPFVLAAAGFLALLLAEGRDRVVRWGRPVRSAPTATTPVAYPRQPAARGRAATGQLTRVGRQVGLTAIAIAVFIPAVIPGLHSGWFGTYHTNGTAGLANGTGTTSISPIIAIQHDLTEPTSQPLFTYTTTGTPTYLRLLTLDKFDGTEWTVSSVTTPNDTRIDKGIPPTPGVTLQPTGSAETDVTVSGALRETYLPTPSTPLTVKAHGDWLYNPINPAIYSPHDTTLHLDYQVTSAVYSPTASQLNALTGDTDTAALQADLTTPIDLPLQITEDADAIVAKAGAVTPYEKALALQTWFQAGTYDLNVNLGSDNQAMLTFIQDRRGYCQQFAAAMALMARIEGIPSRVDIGFTPGSQVGTTNVFQVTTADAHAWPELYFPGAGWLRFEPTPRADGQTTKPAYANTTAVPQASTSPSASSASASPSSTSSSGDLKPGSIRPAKASAHHAGSTRVPIGWIAVALVLVLALAAAPLARRNIRRRRWTAADTEAARAHAAWQELGDDMRDLRLPWRGHDDTPRRATATLLASRQLAYDPGAQQALARLGRAEELARYSARPDELRWVDQDPRADEETVRRALFGSVSRWRRLRARLAPGSTWRIVTMIGTTLTDRRHAIVSRLPGNKRRSGE